MREYSGAENVAITIIKNYSAELKGIYLSPVGSIQQIVEENGIQYYGVDKLSLHTLRHAVRDIKPDIIHAHDYTATIIASLVSGKIPVISHIHNNLPWMCRISTKSLLVYFMMGRVKTCLGVSHSIFNEAWFDFRSRCVTEMIGNPICCDSIKEKKKLSIFSDVVFIGRLTEQKNPLEFLTFIKRLLDDGINVRANMLGEGELRNKCEEFILESKLGNNVCLYGFVKNPYDFMNNNSILIITSKWEGFGLVAMEALSLGMPVVATAVGGLPGIVDDSCGYCSNDFEKRYAEIKKMICDKNYQKVKSKGAYIKSKSLNNIERYMRRIEEIYNGLL
jgi:glycosyltransferase involved in cell wall biosynthesis